MVLHAGRDRECRWQSLPAGERGLKSFGPGLASGSGPSSSSRRGHIAGGHDRGIEDLKKIKTVRVGDERERTGRAVFRFNRKRALANIFCPELVKTAI